MPDKSVTSFKLHENLLKSTVNPLLQRQKLKLRDVKNLDWDHTAGRKLLLRPDLKVKAFLQLMPTTYWTPWFHRAQTLREEIVTVATLILSTYYTCKHCTKCFMWMRISSHNKLWVKYNHYALLLVRKTDSENSNTLVKYARQLGSQLRWVWLLIVLFTMLCFATQQWLWPVPDLQGLKAKSGSPSCERIRERTEGVALEFGLEGRLRFSCQRKRTL